MFTSRLAAGSTTHYKPAGGQTTPGPTLTPASPPRPLTVIANLARSCVVSLVETAYSEWIEVPVLIHHRKEAIDDGYEEKK